MLELLQRIIDGVFLGVTYALLAVGFTLSFGVLRRPNLAYGATGMLGIYLTVWLEKNAGFSPWLFLPILIALTAVLSIYVEALCFAPHAGRAAGVALTSSFAIWMQFEEMAMLVLPQQINFFPSFADGTLTPVAGITVRIDQLAGLACLLALAAGLWLFLFRTRSGLTIRAVTASDQLAASLGVNLRAASRLVVVLAAAVGAIAAFLVISIEGQFSPMFAMWATLKGMLAALIGGLGKVRGAVLGGIALGIAEVLLQKYAGAQYRSLLSYLGLVCLLCLFPRHSTRRFNA